MTTNSTAPATVDPTADAPSSAAVEPTPAARTIRELRVGHCLSFVASCLRRAALPLDALRAGVLNAAQFQYSDGAQARVVGEVIRRGVRDGYLDVYESAGAEWVRLVPNDKLLTATTAYERLTAALTRAWPFLAIIGSDWVTVEDVANQLDRREGKAWTRGDGIEKTLLESQDGTVLAALGAPLPRPSWSVRFRDELADVLSLGIVQVKFDAATPLALATNLLNGIKPRKDQGIQLRRIDHPSVSILLAGWKG